KLWSDASRAETSATSNALRRNELAVITGLADAIGSGLARESLCGHADACSAGLRQCLPQVNGDPPPKSVSQHWRRRFLNPLRSSSDGCSAWPMAPCGHTP